MSLVWERLPYIVWSTYPLDVKDKLGSYLKFFDIELKIVSRVAMVPAYALELKSLD